MRFTLQWTIVLLLSAFVQPIQPSPVHVHPPNQTVDRFYPDARLYHPIIYRSTLPYPVASTDSEVTRASWSTRAIRAIRTALHLDPDLSLKDRDEKAIHMATFTPARTLFHRASRTIYEGYWKHPSSPTPIKAVIKLCRKSHPLSPEEDARGSSIPEAEQVAFYRTMFSREALTMLRVFPISPHAITQLYDVGVHDPDHWIIVMEAMDMDLLRYLRIVTESSSVPMGEEAVLRLLEPIIYTLVQLRRGGFAHRDIKPGNILVKLAPTSDPSDPWRDLLKLSDFGESTHDELDLSSPPRRQAATPPFAPPETRPALAPAATPWSPLDIPHQDVYAIATLLYLLLRFPPADGHLYTPDTTYDPSLLPPITPILLTFLSDVLHAPTPSSRPSLEDFYYDILPLIKASLLSKGCLYNHC